MGEFRSKSTKEGVGSKHTTNRGASAQSQSQEKDAPGREAPGSTSSACQRSPWGSQGAGFGLSFLQLYRMFLRFWPGLIKHIRRQEGTEAVRSAGTPEPFPWALAPCTDQLTVLRNIVHLHVLSPVTPIYLSVNYFQQDFKHRSLLKPK